VNLKVEDYFQNGKRSVLRLSTKGGKEKEFLVNQGDREKPGAKEGGGADLALLCPPRTAVTLDTSMGTEAEAIQSSPRFFLVSQNDDL
jgi:hypothetical protein